MFRFAPSLCLLVAAAVAAPAPVYKPKAGGEGDLKKMQGVWSVVRRTISGSTITTPGGGINTVEIAGDRIRFLVGGEVRTEWVITLDATKNPKVLDRKRVASHGLAAKGGVNKEVTAVGIYRLDGDALSLSSVATTQGDKGRPTDFEGKGRGETLYVLKRVKP